MTPCKATILLVLAVNFLTTGQSQVHFEKTISLPRSNQFANRMVQAKDGNFIIVGVTDAFGSDDIFVLKVDPKEDTLWTTHYGAVNAKDYATDIISTSSGYVITGSSMGYSLKGKTDAFVMKIDETGEWLEYPITIGSEADDIAKDIIETKDGNFVLIIEKWIGYSYSEVFIYKIDKKGNRIWTASPNNSNPSTGGGIVEDENGDIIFTGTVTNQLEKDKDAIVMKLNGKDGQIKWTTTLNDTDNFHESAQAIAKSKGGNFLIAIGKRSPEGRILLYVSVDKSGNYKFGEDSFTLDNSEFSTSTPNHIFETKDGNVLISGQVKGDGFVVKLQPNGQKIFSQTFTGHLVQGLELNNGDLVFIGDKIDETKFRDVFFLKTDSGGRTNN